MTGAVSSILLWTMCAIGGQARAQQPQAQAQPQLPTITLARPTVVIGSDDGNAETLLFGARQALRTRDGRIVVINSGTNQIREFDAQGAHVRTIGRKGGGPGEFQALQQIGLIWGDSIAAYDIGNGRVTIFTPGGKVARSFTIKPFQNAVLPRAAGFTSDGGLLVRADFDRIFRPGPSRDTVAFAVTDNAGTPRSLGKWPAEEAFILAAEEAAWRRTIAFGRDVHASARGERLVVGSSDDFTFDVFFGSGEGRRRYAQPWTPRNVTRAHVAAADRQYLDGTPSQFRKKIEARIGDFPHRETFPAYADLLAAADGRIWVEHAADPASKERKWTVFSASGRAERTVTAAQPLRIVDAGSDYVLAWLRDENEVERIMLFDLAR